MRSIVLGVAMSALASMAVASPPQIKTPFSDDDLRPWTGPGPATVHGQAFLRTVGGDVKTCAGATVILFPLNAYGREILQIDQAGLEQSDNLDPRFATYLRTTTCDAQGNFSFTSLPTGAWGIETNVSWAIPAMPGDEPGPLTALLMGRPIKSEETQGGTMVKEFVASAGDNTVLLTQADRTR